MGKTSVTASIGAVLADMGQKVLMVDGDFQQSLSTYYGIREKAPNGIVQLMTKINPHHCISKTNIKNLNIICSGLIAPGNLMSNNQLLVSILFLNDIRIFH